MERANSRKSLSDWTVPKKHWIFQSCLAQHFCCLQIENKNGIKLNEMKLKSLESYGGSWNYYENLQKLQTSKISEILDNLGRVWSQQSRLSDSWIIHVRSSQKLIELATNYSFMWTLCHLSCYLADSKKLSRNNLLLHLIWVYVNYAN